MPTTDFKMRYVIDADASKAKSTFADLDKQIGGLTGAFSSVSGTAIAGALTGIAAAGAAVGATLFQLTKSASDYGSQIYDASVKTGLGASSISALKLAADQSGSSLEAVTGGIAKFAKTVGAAGEGSKEAAAKLKSLGIEPLAALNDLDGSLAKVFKRIGEAKPGVEQITLAQKAFGKSGADLLPLMEQVGYNLDAFKKRAEELGITIDDKAAKAADEFGDQMTELEAQLAGVGRTIGFELMPVFKDMATYMSNWLADNKGAISQWGTDVANILRGVAGYWRDVGQAMSESRAFGQSPFKSGASQVPWYGYMFGLGGMALANRGAQNAPGETYGPYYDPNDPRARTKPPSFGSDGPGGGKGIRKPPKESDSEFRKFFDDLGWSVGRTYGASINKNSPHKYGGAADLSTGGASVEHPGRAGGRSIGDIFTLMIKSLEKGYRVVDESGYYPAAGIKRTGPNVHVENAKTSLTKSSIFSNEKFTPEQVAYLKHLDQQRLGKATGMGGFEQFQGKQAEDATKSFEAAQKRKMEIAEATSQALIRFDEMYYQKSREMGDSEAATGAAQRIHDQKIAIAEAEVAEAERVAKAQKEGSEEAMAAHDAWAMARIKADVDIAEADEEFAAKQKDLEDDELKRLDAILGRMHDKLDLQQKLNDEEEEYARQRAEEFDRQHQLADFDIIGAFDVDKIKSATEIAAEQMQMLKDMTNDTFQSMASAIGQSIAGWALYGDSIGASLQKATAAILANLAAQAITQAVWETAQGFAMLALGLFGYSGAFASAQAHFRAAAIYAGVGAGAAIGARAVGGGGKGSASGGGAGSGSAYDPNAGPRTYSRVSPDAFRSGNRDSVMHELIDVMRGFKAARPGDVLMQGMRQRPGAVGEQVAKDIRSNAGTGRKILSSAGVR